MLRSYLRQYRMPLVFALALYLLCFAVLRLSALPVTPVLYAMGLGGVLGLTMLVIGYFPYAKRHKLLKGLVIRNSLDHLPPPSDSVEADYQALLEQLFSEKEANAAAALDCYNVLHLQFIHAVALLGHRAGHGIVEDTQTVGVKQLFCCTV